MSDSLLLNPMAAGIVGVTGLLAITSLIRTSQFQQNHRKSSHDPQDYDAGTDPVYRHHPLCTVPAALEDDGVLCESGVMYDNSRSHIDDTEHTATSRAYLDGVMWNEPVFRTH